MGAYEDYVRAVEAARKGKTLEDRVDAAMDADQAYSDARRRLGEFVDAYVKETAESEEIVQMYRTMGNERMVQVVEQDRQHIGSMARQPDGTQTRLLLDDLRVVLHLLERSRVVPRD